MKLPSDTFREVTVTCLIALMWAVPALAADAPLLSPPVLLPPADSRLFMHNWDWDLPGATYTVDQTNAKYDWYVLHSDSVNVGAALKDYRPYNKPLMDRVIYMLDHNDMPYYHENHPGEGCCTLPDNPFLEEFYLHASEPTEFINLTTGNYPLDNDAGVESRSEWRVNGGHTAGDTTIRITPGAYANETGHKAEFKLGVEDIIEFGGDRTRQYEVTDSTNNVFTITPGLVVGVSDLAIIRRMGKHFHITACTAPDTHDCNPSSRIKNIAWGNVLWSFDISSPAWRTWMEAFSLKKLSAVPGGANAIFIDGWGEDFRAATGFRQPCKDGYDDSGGGLDLADARCTSKYDMSETEAGTQVMPPYSDPYGHVTAGGKIREFGGTYDLSEPDVFGDVWLQTAVDWLTRMRAHSQANGVKYNIPNMGPACLDENDNKKWARPLSLAGGGCFTENAWQTTTLSALRFEHARRYALLIKDVTDGMLLLQSSKDWAFGGRTLPDATPTAWETQGSDSSNYPAVGVIEPFMSRLVATQWLLAQIIREPTGSIGHVYLDWMTCQASYNVNGWGCDRSTTTAHGSAADYQWEWLPMFDYALGAPIGDTGYIVKDSYAPNGADTMGPLYACTASGTPFNCCTGKNAGTCTNESSLDWGPCDSGFHYSHYYVYRRDFDNGIVLARPVDSWDPTCGYGNHTTVTRSGVTTTFDMAAVVPLGGVFKQVKSDGTFGTITKSVTLGMGEGVLLAPATGIPALCADGVDNESPTRDGKIDFPMDPDCSSLTDTTEN